MSELQLADTNDKRKARGWWHEEARRMKRAGASLAEIASKFDRTPNCVMMATRGIKSANTTWGRSYRGKSSGHKMGNRMRVAISFTDEQIQALNIISEERNCSFSKAVSDLVDIALEEILS